VTTIVPGRFRSQFIPASGTKCDLKGGVPGATGT
jgi:hypothetical protein